MQVMAHASRSPMALPVFLFCPCVSEIISLWPGLAWLLVEAKGWPQERGTGMGRQHGGLDPAFIHSEDMETGTGLVPRPCRGNAGAN